VARGEDTVNNLGYQLLGLHQSQAGGGCAFARKFIQDHPFKPWRQGGDGDGLMNGPVNKELLGGGFPSLARDETDVK